VERVLVCRSVNEIYKCLDTLPERLDDYYEQCWQRATCEGSSHKRTLAHHILMWVTLAEQPLSLQALIQAARISTDNDSGLENLDCSTVADILFICAGLIRIEGMPFALQNSREHECAIPSNMKVLAAHNSTCEYFHNRRSLHFPASHEIITRTCGRVAKCIAIEPHWAIVPLSSLLTQA
jgi:hypothetical protein